MAIPTVRALHTWLKLRWRDVMMCNMHWVVLGNCWTALQAPIDMLN